MAQFIVRRVEDAVAARLKRRARRNGRSTEDEIRHILREAASADVRLVQPLGTRIAERFRGRGLTADLPELHQPARPADFDE